MAEPQLKLFKIVVGKEPFYFNRKVDAKRARDDLLLNTSDRVVMRGPDHWRGESFNKTSSKRGW